MPVAPFHTTLTSPEMTADLAKEIGQVLRAGDVLLLSGDIGAGKTHFARSLIQSLQKVPEDVPSPTFTLVQVYETSKGELWHADLYRLSHADEVVELGLLEAFENAICLVEWPDRLDDLAPANALSLGFAMTPDAGTRTLDIIWTAPEWSARLEGITNAIA